MKYLYLLLIYLAAVFVFFTLDVYDNGWQILQPFLVAMLLVYFNSNNSWIQYSFAILAGFFVDSFTAIFGLNAFIFVSIIFSLKLLQVTILTSKNFLAIVILTIFSFVLYWLIFWLADLIFNWDVYILNLSTLFNILKIAGIDILSVLAFHLIYYNFFLRHHEQGQSF